MLLRNQQQLALNQVETLCIEAADHYEAAAHQTDDPKLVELFEELAEHRNRLAAELATHIRAMDDLPQAPDPDRETADDVLSAIKSFFSADGRETLIEDREEFEHRVAEAAQAALQQPMPESTKLLLGRIVAHAEEACHLLSAAARH